MTVLDGKDYLHKFDVIRKGMKMPDLKTFINSKLPEIEEMKKTATDRNRIVNNFMDQAAEWLNDYKREGLLDFKVEEEKDLFNLIRKSIVVTALLKSLYIRQITAPEIFIIKIHDTDISCVNGNWLYKEQLNDSIVNKEIFEEILIKELSEADYYY